MDVELPDGTVIEGIPDGTSRADLLVKLHKNGYNISSLVRPEKIGREAFKDVFKQELADNPIGANLAAFGTAASDLWHGAKQLVGADDKQARENNALIKDAHPISALAGNVAMYGAAGAAAPVLNTLKGATLGGAAIGSLSPTDNDNVALGKLENAAIGAGAGAVGVGVGKAVGGAVSNARQAANTLKRQNATRDATQLASQEAGYVLPPSYAGGGTLSRLAEGVSGKYKTNQAAQILNQRNTNNLARQFLGMPEGEAFSESAIQRLKDVNNVAYRDVAALPSTVTGQQTTRSLGTGATSTTPIAQTGDEVLNALKDARFNSKLNWQHFNRTGDPEAYAKATALDAQAATLENTLETIAQKNGSPDLVKSLQESRRNLAKIHTIDRAMNDATGDVDAKALAKVLEKGGMLSDEAEQIARFAQAYKDVAGVPKSGDANPFTVLDYASALLGYGVSPAALALPVARVGSRAAILSPAAQKAMANKSYGVGPTKKLAEAILASRYSPMAFTGAALPSLAQ